MPLKRRTVLGLLSGSTFLLTAGVGTGATGMPATRLPRLQFPQGVASGDPRPDAVMLWTRAEPPQDHDGIVPLLLQVSRNSNFTSLELQAPLSTDVASDFTVRCYVDGLQPDTFYYYRFLGGEDSASRTGRTRTAPAADQARQVNVAFASCQQYEHGHYGAWARMLADDLEAPEDEQIDFVLHLGDFIYERCWNTFIDGSPLARRIPPFPDGASNEKNRHAVSLADYRLLYKTYLTDPDLQAARARWPFVCTWDDHEFSNDNHQSYSTYTEERALEPERKQWANQAWFEYIPAVLDELEGQPAHNFRPADLAGDDAARNSAAVDTLCIYRQLRWGKHVDVLITDVRSYRTPDCLPAGFAEKIGQPLTPVELVDIADAGSAYNEGNPPKLLPFGDGTTPNPAWEREPGTVLGTEQRGWFLTRLIDSDATWKLWGNALPIVSMRLDMSSLPFAGYLDSVFNLDSWSGYPYEVDYLFSQIESNDITGLVSLSGDHHMHAAGTLQRQGEPGSQAVGADFAVAGISSSPLFMDVEHIARHESAAFAPLVLRDTADGTEPVWNMTLLEGVLSAYTYHQTGIRALADWLGPNEANPGLGYIDSTANGYGIAHFRAQEVAVRLVSMEDCRPAFSQPPAKRHVAHFTLPLWQPGQPARMEGPHFEGGAPFPFEPPKV